VTGATSGLGLATALRLAAMGATVVVHGRDPARCADAAEAVARASASGTTVDRLVADLGDLEHVRRLAADFRERHARLDVLVNNAGATFPRRALTPEGVERTLAVNHLAPFLLTSLLTDLLRASAPARVVTVASVAHEHGRLDLDDLPMDRGYRPFAAYSRSKLANVLFTRELARRLEGTGVTANAVHPGLVRTGLMDRSGAVRRAGWQLIHVAYRRSSLTPEEGAEWIVELAASPALEAVTGRYFAEGRDVEPAAAARDPELAARLWAVSEERTGALAGVR